MNNTEKTSAADARLMKKRGRGIIFKSLSAIILMLIGFTAAVAQIGYIGFTQALLDQYSDGAFRTANIASSIVDADRMDAYAASGGEGEEYEAVWNTLSELCNASDVTFIYVIQPDQTDYEHITFIFSTKLQDADYTLYDFGYYRETTNDEYRAKYRSLCEGESNHELVIRDKGYIETDPHITAMTSLIDSNDEVKGIVCVQRQMDKLITVRNAYLRNVFITLFVLLALVITVHSFYLTRVCLNPVRRITIEACRFADESTLGDQKLTDTIHNKDEIGMLAESIDKMEERIVNYVDEMTVVTAEKERISTELSLASKIQANKLPNRFPAFPDRKEFDIYAMMKPAKLVGGDFYDFFLIDDDHLCMLIADVSGKGIPAALFMMSSKITISNFAKMGKSPGKILSAANEEIHSENNEDMFLSVWLGILELSTGKLKAANAGHEYPAIMQPSGSFELFRDKHGFVLGGISGLGFKDYELSLRPGAKLMVYTDGVPEAQNGENELFGTDKMLAALNEEPGAAPQKLLQNVCGAVDAFVGEAEQFDDLTMLCVEYKGGCEN